MDEKELSSDRVREVAVGDVGPAASLEPPASTGQTLQPGLAAVDNIVQKDDSKSAAPATGLSAIAARLNVPLENLQAMIDAFGGPRTKEFLELVNVAAAQGVASPATQAKLMEVLSAETGFMAQHWIPGASGAMEIKSAITGQDSKGAQLSTGHRILEGVKGVFSILFDLHTFGVGRGIVAAMSTASKVTSAADRLEQAAHAMPLLKAAALDPAKADLMALMIEVVAHPSFSHGLRASLETAIVNAIDGTGPTTTPAKAPETVNSSTVAPEVAAVVPQRDSP